MCDRQDVSLKKRHSFYEPQFRKDSAHSGAYCRSDVNIVLSNEFANQSNLRELSRDAELTSTETSGCGEYYKRYEHDAMPVKDDSASCDATSIETGKGDRIPLTESHLVTLEKNILSDISQDQTSASSGTLESCTKGVKTTVEDIFDKFYANMHDFELYKKKYQAILTKNREDSVEEMEDFIKDMIHHIMSSESSDFNDSRLCEVTDRGTTVSTAGNSTHCSILRNLHSVVEAFKNDHYLTDSTADEKGCMSKQEVEEKVNNAEILSIYLLSGNPCVEIKMNNRKLLSEVNIKDSRVYYEPSTQAASAEDIKKVAAKKLALEKYERQQNEMYTPRHFLDREIPVKLSFAKKNIHLDEDFDHESIQSEKSFISRICNYLCKRLRKTSIV